MNDLFDYAEIEVDEDEERYCIFCEGNFLTVDFAEHHTSEFHIQNRKEKLEVRDPDEGTCGECQYLDVEDDIDFYCLLEFDSPLASAGYLDTEQESDGRYIPRQPTACSIVNIWRTP